MTADEIIVLTVGIISILFTYYYFFGKKDEKVKALGSLDIIVSGGYSPSTIVIKNKASTTLNFLRKDENTCLEEISIPDFKVKKYLPLNEKVSITLTPSKIGNYPFSCGMNMYFGKIEVI